MLGSTADGKRLAVLRRSSQARAYIGQLEAGGTRMLLPRKLTFSDANDFPFAWTPDSKEVIINSDRNGHFELFKQPLDQETATPLVTGSQEVEGARLSADGSWILYSLVPKWFGPATGPSVPIPLMRVPVTGGPSQLVLETRNGVDSKCARAPATLCVLEEASPDNKLHTLTAVDPVKGRGRVLATIPVDPRAVSYVVPSPDGTRLAFLKMHEPQGHVQLLALDGQPVGEIVFKSWPGCTSLSWAPDGKGMYCGTMTPQGATLLHVDLDGSTQVLWQQRGAVGDFGIWGEPSPDGRYLAIVTEMMDSNIWMLEHF
jgi:Tol biopolymer transport system component